MLIIKRKIPNLIFKVLMKIYEFRIISKNDKCVSYRKDVYTKDEYNYGICNEIHIFDDMEFGYREICVTPHYFRSDMYDWYSGEEAKCHLTWLLPKLLKYTEIEEVGD